jgi:MFS family permease
LADDRRSNETIKDGPSGWLLVFALFIMLSVVVAARNSIGLLMPIWNQEFQWSYGFVSAAGSVMLLTMACIAPLAGHFIDHHGYKNVFAAGMTVIAVAFLFCSWMTEGWQLICFYSLLAGVGFAVISPSLVAATVAQFFEKQVGLATSMATSGSTGGQVALMPLLGLLIMSTSWRSGLTVVSLLILATMILLLVLLKGRSFSQARSTNFVRQKSLREILILLSYQKTFWLLSGGFFICGFTTVGIIKIHFIPYAVFCGFPVVQSSLAYGVLSGFSLLGMILYGYWSDRFNRPMLLASIYFLRALTFVLLMHISDSVFTLFFFAVAFGLFDYATFPILASLVSTHIGRHIMGVTMGIIFSSHSVGGALGSFLGGYLFELFAKYDWVWVLGSCLAVLAGILSLCISEGRGDQAVPKS